MAKIIQSGLITEDDRLMLSIQGAVGASSKKDMLATIDALSTALALEPKRADLWHYLGVAYAQLQVWSACITSLEMALALEPDRVRAQCVMASALYHLGQHGQAIALIDDACRRGAPGIFWAMRASIHGHTNRDLAHTLRVYQDWGRRFADPLTRKAKPLVVKDRSPRKRLKVGYVTADFRTHSVAFFMHPVLCHHNPDAVEIHVYASNKSDAFTETIRQSVPYWHDVVDLSDEALYERIRADGIDVLVDLSGHTNGQRLLVFARSAAPVQVTWIGYMLQLGMKAMDYRLIDHNVAPLGHEKYYSETLFRLACMASYSPPEYAPLCKELPLL